MSTEPAALVRRRRLRVRGEAGRCPLGMGVAGVARFVVLVASADPSRRPR